MRSISVLRNSQLESDLCRLPYELVTHAKSASYARLLFPCFTRKPKRSITCNYRSDVNNSLQAILVNLIECSSWKTGSAIIRCLSVTI